jgi:hypothetical protein
MRFQIVFALLLASTALARAEPLADTRLGRTEALAILQSLNADLLGHDSATLTLDRWCESHGLSGPSGIRAERLRDADKPATPELRTLLGVGADESIRYRRVRLSCNGHILSEADNWYVPVRLTPEMNRQLDTTDIAFGRAVQDLHFRRQTLSANLLWQPLPQGWDMKAPPANENGAPLQIPDSVLEHRAILTLPDGTPFSALIETYTKAVFDFRR